MDAPWELSYEFYADGYLKTEEEVGGPATMKRIEECWAFVGLEPHPLVPILGAPIGAL